LLCASSNNTFGCLLVYAGRATFGLKLTSAAWPGFSENGAAPTDIRIIELMESRLEHRAAKALCANGCLDKMDLPGFLKYRKSFYSWELS